MIRHGHQNHSPRSSGPDVFRRWPSKVTSGSFGGTVQPADFTVADLAVRFGRKPSTVRGWCELGRLPGAYRMHGREWRIPVAALAAFEAEARRPKTASESHHRPSGQTTDLGAWRHAS